MPLPRFHDSGNEVKHSSLRSVDEIFCVCVVLSILLYMVALTFKFVDEILLCGQTSDFLCVPDAHNF